MNERCHLILVNGENKTSGIQYCKYNPNTKKYDVTFKNGKTYPYNYNSIEWIKNPEVLNPNLVQVSHGDIKLFNIQSIFVFHALREDYWHICFSSGSARTYEKRSLKFEVSCLREEESQNRLLYLKQLAAINELKGENGETLLKKQYERLKFIPDETAMAIYLNPEKHMSRTYN